MLLSLTLQRCDHCGRQNPLDRQTIQRSPLDEAVLILPDCACGARECLCVTSREDNPGPHAALVRQLADALHTTT